MTKIKAGEEITINYFGSDSLMGMLFKKWRRDIFLSELPFDCKCELCEKGTWICFFVSVVFYFLNDKILLLNFCFDFFNKFLFYLKLESLSCLEFCISLFHFDFYINFVIGCVPFLFYFKLESLFCLEFCIYLFHFDFYINFVIGCVPFFLHDYSFQANRIRQGLISFDDIAI